MLCITLPNDLSQLYLFDALTAGFGCSPHIPIVIATFYKLDEALGKVCYENIATLNQSS